MPAPDGPGLEPVRPDVPWTINGRFLGQGGTGVQRYAREVTTAIADLIRDDDPLAAGLSLNLAVPPGTKVPCELAGLPHTEPGWGNGHLWEQTALVRLPGGLLGLCNTGPAFFSRQIVCIHDANVYLCPESYSRLFQAYYRALLPRLGRIALAITTVSRFSANQLVRLGIATADKITVLPNGHEHVRRWDPSRSALAGRFAGARPFVFLLGSRARHKNVQLLLDIAPDLDRMGLDVVVAGGLADVFAAERTASRAGNVRFLGYVSEDDLAFLYRSALLLAFPSLVEGFGLPVLEAMALGCPVVSADTASMPEIGGDAILYAAPDDPAGWIDRIGQVLADAGLRQSLAARGPERASLFSWRETARGYLALLHSHGARP